MTSQTEIARTRRVSDTLFAPIRLRYRVKERPPLRVALFLRAIVCYRWWRRTGVVAAATVLVLIMLGGLPESFVQHGVIVRYFLAGEIPEGETGVVQPPVKEPVVNISVFDEPINEQVDLVGHEKYLIRFADRYLRVPGELQGSASWNGQPPGIIGRVAIGRPLVFKITAAVKPDVQIQSRNPSRTVPIVDDQNTYVQVGRVARISRIDPLVDSDVLNNQVGTNGGYGRPPREMGDENID